MKLVEVRPEKELTAFELMWVIDDIKHEFVDETYKLMYTGVDGMIKIVNAENTVLALINIKTRRVKIIGYANWYYIDAD